MTGKFLRRGAAIVACLLSAHAWADACHISSYGTLPVEMLGTKPTTTVKINGTDTRFILDTGAMFNMMSESTAKSQGLRLRPAPFEIRMSGVGGSTSVQLTRVKQFGLLGTSLSDIEFLVGGSDTGYGLLGANLLDLVDLEIDLAHGKMTLMDASKCDNHTSFAYWASGAANWVDTDPPIRAADRRTALTVVINGKKVHAIIDSGASATIIDVAAAKRIGIDLTAPGVKTGLNDWGIGGRMVRSWIVPIDSFTVGSETIHHSEMAVIDSNLGDPNTDMLLGVDFLLAHHLFIANSQHRIYFTYNGGRVFSYASANSAAQATQPDAPASGSEQKSAADYALLGDAQLSRGETAAALDSLNHAIGTAPNEAGYYLSRSRAYNANHQPKLALADLDQALTLQPKNLDALLLRAQLRAYLHDRDGALADTDAAAALIPPGSDRTRQLTYVYVQLDQPAKALTLLDPWIEQHPNDAQLAGALNERCFARGLANQDLDDALKDCRKAIRRAGPLPAYLDSEALVQLRLGHYDDAIATYQQAVTALPKSAWSRYGLGIARIRAGQVDEGKADLAAARVLQADIDVRAAKYGLQPTTP